MGVNDREADRALALAVGHVNVSARHPVSAAAVLAALRSDIVPAALVTPVRALLDETDIETLSDLVLSGAIGYADLGRHAAALLEADHETRLWLAGHD